MKRWVMAAAALALLTPAVAAARDDPHHGGGPQVHQNGGHAQFGHGGPAQHAGGQRFGGQHFTPNRGAQFTHNNHAQATFNRGPTTFNRGPNGAFNRPDGNRPNGNRPGGNRPGGNRATFNGNRNFARGAAGGHSFQFRGHSYAAVHLGAFHYPHGWGYRRWAVGNYLPLFFLSAPYFFDYGEIGLPPPPPGAYWVRYGPDALLVDRYSGRVINVVYGVFY